MIRLFKALYENAVAEQDAKRASFDTEQKILKETSTLVTERPDIGGWIRNFAVNDREKGMLVSSQLDMVRKAREFARFDPNARAALTTLVHYVMGKGLSITPKAADPMVWYIWREFWTAPRNKMPLKQFEIVGRVFRDGEIFIEFLSKGEGEAETGKATVRFIDPLLVRPNDTGPVKKENATASINNGVNTDPNDVEKVVSYSVQLPGGDGSQFREVKAENVIHIKINVDSDQKRGETHLLPIMKMVKHYEQWIENRIILNKMRSAIILVRKVEGTASEVANMAATLPTARNPSNIETKKNFRGGTILTAGPGVSYDMLSANINATDAKEDGRNIKTTMAAGMNLPEYMFGDASNQNYASSLIAESPFVKAIQFWQIFFEFWFSQIYRKVIEIAVAGGKLEAPNDEEFINKLKTIRDIKEAEPTPVAKPGEDPKEGKAPPEDVAAGGDPNDELSPKEKALAELMPNGKMETPTEIFFGCDMDWPEIVHRDVKQFAEALSLARSNGWIADSTACAALGYDYVEEVRKQRQIEEEAAKSGNTLLGGNAGDIGDDPQMDAELEDMLGQLSPEERDGVLKAKDPRQVVRIMKKKQGAAAGAED